MLKASGLKFLDQHISNFHLTFHSKYFKSLYVFIAMREYKRIKIP